MSNKPVGKINIKLLENVNVKINNNVTIKDFYSSILSNQNLYTTSLSEYNKALVPDSGVSKKDNNKSPVVPKYYVVPDSRGMPTCTLIGNCLIATPEALNFDSFFATLDNYGKGENGYAKSSFGDLPGWCDNVVNGFYHAMPRKGNLLKNSTSPSQLGDAFSITGGVVNGGQTALNGGTSLAGATGSGGGSDTTGTTCWISLTEKNGIKDVCGFREGQDGVFKYTKSTPGSLISQFSLQPNQPFAIRFKIFSFSPELSFAYQGKPSSVLAQSPNDQSLGGGGLSLTALGFGINPLNPNVVVSWGNVSLTFYKKETVGLSIGGQSFGNPVPLPGGMKDTDKYSEFHIYPLGDTLYIYPGGITTEHTIKKNYVSFRLSKPLFIPAGKIQMDFNCAEANFNFSPIVHPNSGRLSSPLFGGGFTPSKTVIVPSFIGKYGVGQRKSPITFPDINDKDNNYAYMGKTNITVNLNGTGTYSYDLILGVLSDGNALGASLQQQHASIINSITSNLLSVANGSQTLAQGQAAAQASTQLGINGMLGTLTGLGFDGTSFGNSLALSYSSLTNFLFNPSTFYGDVNYAKSSVSAGSTEASNYGTGSILSEADATNYVQNKAQQMFGMGTNPLDSISKSITRTALRLGIKSKGGNIYSPAIFNLGVTLIAPLVNVSMNPNPQIDNCDVLSVSVQQQVEGSSATVVLDNRVPCETNQGVGVYTYTGQNNFTGIKPIQIAMGYQGGSSSDNALQTVFTGYVTKYNYARTSDNQSVCELTCEGIEKKIKEQFAVNLPFMDGWCHLGALYYLAREAGFADNEMLFYEDPITGKSITLRSLLQGDPDALSGGCFEGHINDTPPGANNISSSQLHACLPLAVLGQESPNYNFTFGTKLWECMHKIREFSNFYLFCNAKGHLIYGAPQQVVQDSNYTFVEVDTMGNFNEIKRRLDVSSDTAEMRNAVFVQGISCIPGKDTASGWPEWNTHIHVEKKPNFPNDVNEPSYAPWLRYAFLRNPKYEDVAATRLNAAEIFRRCKRRRLVGEWEGWGNPLLFPYFIVRINESRGETGISMLPLIIASHTISISGETFELSSTFSAENFDAATVDYDPYALPSQHV